MKLTKLADVKFFERKRNEREISIQEAMFIEDFEGKGLTPEDFKKKALGILELEEGSVTAEYGDILKKQNVEAQAFISVVNSISKLEATGAVTDKELDILRASEEKLAEMLAKRYEVDVERLYEDVNLGDENE